MKYLLSILFFGLLSLALAAQPAIEWTKTYGGNYAERSNCMLPTTDGGYVLVGRSESADGDATLHYGLRDVWVVKTDASGALQWQKSYGGTNNETGMSVVQMADGGYIVGGFSSSNDFDVSGRHGTNYDAWIFKISSSGALEWQKMYGGTGDDGVTGMVKTSDNGCILTGYTNSTNGDISGNHGSYDCFILKLNTNGDILWQKLYGGSYSDQGNAIIPTSDGGFMIAGEVSSPNANVPNFQGSYDYWAIKLDAAGDIQWQKAMGGTDSDVALATAEAADGGFVLAGYTYSRDGNVAGLHQGFNNDYWIVKLSATGELEWAKTYGGNNFDAPNSIILDQDGGYIVGGKAVSFDGDVVGQHGQSDFWLIKLDTAGTMVWQKTIGGGDEEEITCLLPLATGGFIASGYTFSTNNDVTGNHGDLDMWVVKCSATVGTVAAPAPQPLKLFPNPAREVIFLEIPKDERIAAIHLYDLWDRPMPVALTPGNRSLQIGALPQGSYRLYLTTESGKRYAQSFVKLNTH